MPATGPEPFGAPLALCRGKPSPFRERKGNADGDGAFRRERVTALLGARATREGFGGATCGSVVQETERREIWGAGGFLGAGRRMGSANTSAMGDPSVRSTHSPSCWGIPAAPGHHPLPSLKDAGKGRGITDPQRPPTAQCCPQPCPVSLLLPQVGLDGVGRRHGLDETNAGVADPEQHIPAGPGEREGLSGLWLSVPPPRLSPDLLRTTRTTAPSGRRKATCSSWQEGFWRTLRSPTRREPSGMNLLQGEEQRAIVTPVPGW